MIYKLEQTKSTPLISIDVNENIQRMEGISIPIDAYEFYKPIAEFIESNKLNFKLTAEFQFRLTYFNTSSSKAIFNVLQKINEICKEIPGMKIVWEYEEEDDFMLETGQEFGDLLNADIEFRKN